MRVINMKGLKWASYGFLVLLPLMAVISVLGVVLYWGFGIDRIHSGLFGQNFIVLASHPPVPTRQIWGFLANLPPLGLWIYSLWRLFEMFRGFTQGSLIGLRTIEHLRGFSIASFFAVIIAFLLSGIMRWAAGVFDNAPLWTHLGFSTTHASMAFTSAIVFFASYIIEEGYEYQQEVDDYI